MSKKSGRFFEAALAVVFSFCLIGDARANLQIVKTYKQAFEQKTKCTFCHVDKTPKKEEGKHNPNEYGKKILAAKKELKKETVDEEVLKKAGRNEAVDAE